ncbi:MAG: lipoyl(octanoyl) transferase LipB [Bacteroidia bacterium]|nr:lipoyl(octanoyl) transferase LipB [Bacteroidia bacterium]HMU76207.1 lipoyl(octanoyl) transferase LipB [Bacteroidia bacterium]HMX96084.1 lipoyl(octanoyl) transferase LipB [Bacteroidia bacterium]HMY63081.1 lipoyl(octanoyl) transferase LipB [Bacteroidia bacterium]HNN09586.1 lipoyl(octanoyl) transferase LipB [Bacteroidia bacterium]
MQEIFFADLGSSDYKQTWDFQEQLLQQIMQLKLEGRNQGLGDHAPTPHYLLFCEHPHVFTLGKSGKPEHLLSNEQQLKNANADYYKINRGGDITYHGPGQIVGYPILNLDLFFNDIHRYMRFLEEVIIRTLKEYGIEGSRIEKLTGVWIDAGKPSARKICAFGVRCSRWITMHGWALNVNTQLDYFNHIVPCGISDKAVTSMAKELGNNLNIDEVKSVLLKHFSDVFNATIKTVEKEKLIAKEKT